MEKERIEFSIREARIEDAAAIAKVHLEMWKYAYKGQLPDGYLNSLSCEKYFDRWVEKLSIDDPSRTILVCVDASDTIVGFCSFGPSRAKNSQGKGELYAVYVSPFYKRRGIGKLLMKTAVETLREFGYQKLILCVLKSNTDTHLFYEKMGWRRAEKESVVEIKDGVKFELIYYEFF